MISFSTIYYKDFVFVFFVNPQFVFGMQRQMKLNQPKFPYAMTRLFLFANISFILILVAFYYNLNSCNKKQLKLRLTCQSDSAVCTLRISIFARLSDPFYHVKLACHNIILMAVE